MKGFHLGKIILGIGVTLALLSAPSSAAAIELNGMMSQQDQRVTGVWRLSKSERRALEKWMGLWAGRAAAESSTFKEGMDLETWVIRLIPDDFDPTEFADVNEAPALPSSEAREEFPMSPDAGQGKQQSPRGDTSGTAPARSPVKADAGVIAEAAKRAPRSRFSRLNTALSRFGKEQTGS